MCGIVGFVGKNQAAPILLDGLSKLEYRGYDSAGIAVIDDNKIVCKKAKGRIDNLRSITQNGTDLSGIIGIGHTRWATHGEPSDVNSHPHITANGKFAVVHNGIIENYIAIRDKLISKGYRFLSDTDTETVTHLLDYYYEGNLLNAVIKVMNKIEGSYALGILCSDYPDKLVVVKKDSPLVIGIGDGENYIASDVTAIVSHTRNVIYLEDREIALIDCDSVNVFDMNKEDVQKEIKTVDWNIDAAEKSGYEHFMIKEIMEQPRVIRDTINPHIQNGEVILNDISLSDEELKDISKIVITACGSAYHAGVVGRYVIEELARIPVEVDLASEFRYRRPIIDEHTLVIAISQSGETADTLAAIREAKRLGAKTLSIINVIGSSIAKETDSVIYTVAGPEIAVATTKAYTAQLCALYLFAIKLGRTLGRISDDYNDELICQLGTISEKVKKILSDLTDDVQQLASTYFGEKNIFFIGRNIDYATALEGSLKLKEISYIHSEAYAAGELKHGTISLIEKGRLVVALACQNELFDKLMSNVKEVKARGAKVIVLKMSGTRDISSESDHIIEIPDINRLFSASLAAVPLQLFGYYMAAANGCDIDKPRNLAKSVTVE